MSDSYAALETHLLAQLDARYRELQAQLQLMIALAREGNGQPASPAVAPPPAEPAKPKLKVPANWKCPGNVVAGTPCPVGDTAVPNNKRVKWQKKLMLMCAPCAKAAKKSIDELKKQEELPMESTPKKARVEEEEEEQPALDLEEEVF